MLGLHWDGGTLGGTKASMALSVPTSLYLKLAASVSRVQWLLLVV